jgi:hypothetical protein
MFQIQIPDALWLDFVPMSVKLFFENLVAWFEAFGAPGRFESVPIAFVSYMSDELFNSNRSEKYESAAVWASAASACQGLTCRCLLHQRPPPRDRKQRPEYACSPLPSAWVGFRTSIRSCMRYSNRGSRTERHICLRGPPRW